MVATETSAYGFQASGTHPTGMLSWPKIVNVRPKSKVIVIGKTMIQTYITMTEHTHYDMWKNLNVLGHKQSIEQALIPV